MSATTGSNTAPSAFDQAPSDPAISVGHLDKVYERLSGRELISTHALTDVSFDIAENEFVSLIGTSGSGKSTVLKIVGGLESATRGRIEVIGAPVTGPGPERATVFQSPGLMPWKSVLGNIELAMRFAGIPRGERRERALQYTELVGLSEFADYLPTELSGGMQQRVGIARALAMRPEVLLMDEPFGALDAITRAQMQTELLRIWEHDKRTVLFVTHGIEEAILLSDRILVLSHGVLVHECVVDLPRPRSRHQVATDPAAVAMTEELESYLGVQIGAS